MKKITVHQSLIVNACPETVWEVTQNIRYRPDWDPAVESAELVDYDPVPVIRLKFRDGTAVVMRYKLLERPRRTSLVIAESTSRIICGGGGSWVYEPVGESTRWSQTNTVVLNGGWRTHLLSPLIRIALKHNTRRSMLRAKELVEKWH